MFGSEEYYEKMEARMLERNAPSNIPGLTNTDVFYGTIGMNPGGHHIHDRDDERLLDPTLQARVAYWLAPKAYSLKEIKEECRIRQISREGNKRVLALKLAFRQVPENVNMLDGLLSAPAPPKAVDNGGTSATAKGKEASKKPAAKKTQKKSVAKKTATTKSKSPTSVAGSTETAPLAAAVSAEEEGWKYIDTAETLVFLFQEKDHHIPYSMEVIWVVPGKGEFFMEESFTGFNGRCAEKFIPLIEDATKKAKKLKDFQVRYNNGRDRTWPYTKVLNVAKAVARVKNCEVVLESIDKDYCEFNVDLNEVGQHAGGKVGDVSSFVGNVDFSSLTNPLQRYFILDYIGENAAEELFHPAGKSEKKSAVVVKKKTTAKAKYPPSFKGCKTCGNTDHNRCTKLKCPLHPNYDQATART